MSETILGTGGRVSALGEAKVIGGVGSILTLLGLAPFIGTAVVVVGWVLVLVAIGLISGVAGDKQIFYNATVGAGLQIVGAVGLYLVGLSLFSNFGAGTASNPLGVPGSVFDRLLLLWVVAIVSSVFLYMSLTKVASRMGAGLFATAAIIYVIGEGTTIVLIGFIIALVAQLLFAAAFFSMPEALPGSIPASTSTQQTMPTSSYRSAQQATSGPLERSYCTNCGARLESGVTFCPYCGSKAKALG